MAELDTQLGVLGIPGDRTFEAGDLVAAPVVPGDRRTGELDGQPAGDHQGQGKDDHTARS